MTKRSGWLISLILLLALMLTLPWTVVRAEQTLTEQGVLSASEVKDSIEFNAALRAAKPELLGQYARTSMTRTHNGNIVLDSEEESQYSTEPQSMKTIGDACVFGGAGSPGCLTAGDAASATTKNGTMDPISAQARVVLALVSINANVAENFTTGARCWIDSEGVPRGEGQRPAGKIAYRGTGLLGAGFNETFDLSNPSDLPDTKNGETIRIEEGVGAVLGLLLTLNLEVLVTPSWGWNESTLRAYSEVDVTYLIKNSSEQILDQASYIARSECGLMMNNGEGSDSPGGMSVQGLMGPQLRGLAEPARPVEPTSALGMPRQTGFTAEDTLITDEGAAYHLLATRELDLQDRWTVARVLEAIREDSGVEGRTAGADWSIYSAEAAGELVPVLEIELADTTVIQVRPNLPGVLLPSPDQVVIDPPAPEITPTVSLTPEEPAEPAEADELDEPAEPAEADELDEVEDA